MSTLWPWPRAPAAPAQSGRHPPREETSLPTGLHLPVEADDPDAESAASSEPHHRHFAVEEPIHVDDEGESDAASVHRCYDVAGSGSEGSEKSDGDDGDDDAERRARRESRRRRPPRRRKRAGGGLPAFVAAVGPAAAAMLVALVALVAWKRRQRRRRMDDAPGVP